VVFSIEAALSNFISVCKRNSISVIFMPFFARTNYVAKDREYLLLNGPVSCHASCISIQFWSLFSRFLAIVNSYLHLVLMNKKQGKMDIHVNHQS
jgi:hypothetical protein